jgi:hypothetical protein
MDFKFRQKLLMELKQVFFCGLIVFVFIFFVSSIRAQEIKTTDEQPQNIKLEEIFSIENPGKYSVAPKQSGEGFQARISSNNELMKIDDQKNKSIQKKYPKEVDIVPLPNGNVLVSKGIDEERANIWLEDGNGSILRDITKTDGVDTSYFSISAHDGSWLMLFDDNPKAIRTLVYDRDGNLINSSPSPVAGFTNFCVSNDNQLVGLVASGNNNFYLFDKNGSMVQKIKMDAWGEDCKFSNDGKQIVFVSRKSLYFMDLATFEVSQILIPQAFYGDCTVNEFKNRNLVLITNSILFLIDAKTKKMEPLAEEKGRFFHSGTSIGNYVAVANQSEKIKGKYYLTLINDKGQNVLEQRLPALVHTIKSFGNYLFFDIANDQRRGETKLEVFKLINAQ